MSKLQTFSESGKGRPVTAVSSLTSRETAREGATASTEAPSGLDSSKCLHLSAQITAKKNLNNTGVFFTAISQGTPRAKKGRPGEAPKEENRGGRRERKADGLTGRGKSLLKIIGDCYNKLVTEPEFFGQWKFEAFHRWYDANKDKDFDQDGQVSEGELAEWKKRLELYRTRLKSHEQKAMKFEGNAIPKRTLRAIENNRERVEHYSQLIRGVELCRLRDIPFRRIERMFEDHWGLADGGNPFDAFNRFITLTYRTNEFTKDCGLVPDDMEGKKMLGCLLRRFSRHKGRNIHYIWVAERQKNGTIHFHILTPERLLEREEGEDSKAYFQREAEWINQHWNETVMNWAYQKKAINEDQRKQWQSEYCLSQGYYRELAEWKLEGGEKPKAPEAQFLLCPNLTWANNAGHYMAKYMSKQGQNIAGGMFDASQESRVFLQKEVTQVAAAEAAVCNAALKKATFAAREQKIFARYFELWDGATGVWCGDMAAMEPILKDVLLNLERVHPTRKNEIPECPLKALQKAKRCFQGREFDLAAPLLEYVRGWLDGNIHLSYVRGWLDANPHLDNYVRGWLDANPENPNKEVLEVLEVLETLEVLEAKQKPVAVAKNNARRRFELAPEDFDDGTDFEPQNQDHEKQALPF